MSVAHGFKCSPPLACRCTLALATLLVSAFVGDARQLRPDRRAREVAPELVDAGGDAVYPCEDGCAGSFTYKVDRPVRVILWTSNVLFYKQYIERHAPNCVVVRAFQSKAEDSNDDDPNVVEDPDYDISGADVVVFNMAILEQNFIMPSSKPAGQLWVAGCWEPAEFGEHNGGDPKGGEHTFDCSLLRDLEVMARMDATATYSLDSTYPALFTPPTEEQMRRSEPAFSSGPIAASTVSDCRAAGRNEWLSAMAASLACPNRQNIGRACVQQASAVSFYGDCLHNQEEPACAKDDEEAIRMGKEDDLQDVFIKRANRCAARPFALVAENSQTPWYVTEKIWNALASGSVPVYWGPPEAKYLVPPGSSLFASDYESEEELARAMLEFGGAEHRRAREFKTLPVQQWGNWTTARRLSRSTLLPRLCEAASLRAAIR